LIGDGLRKILPLAAELAAENELEGWRQHEHLVRQVRKLVRAIGRTARAKSRGADRLKPGYQKLLALAEEVLARARRLLRELAFAVPQPALLLEELKNAVPPAPREKLLFHYVSLTAQVCVTARRRVLEGGTLANDEKIFSIFEPHTELIKRGKQPVEIQYGHNVLVIEDAVGFVVDYRVVANGVLDLDLVVPVMRQLQQRYRGKIKSASFDRAFHTPENQRELATIVRTPCIASKGREKGRQQQKEGTVAFRKARQNHPGVESGIGALQSGNGQKRCRDKSKRGFERYVALGILGRNLQTLGKLLLARDAAECQAAKSHALHPRCAQSHDSRDRDHRHCGEPGQRIAHDGLRRAEQSDLDHRPPGPPPRLPLRRPGPANPRAVVRRQRPHFGYAHLHHDA